MLMIWGFDYIEDLHVQIIGSVALLILVVTTTIDTRHPQSNSAEVYAIILGFMLVSLSMLAMAFGDRYSLPYLVLNAAAFLLSVPLSIAYWWTIRGRSYRILIVAMVPTVALAFIYLTVEIFHPATFLDFFLLPLPFVLTIGLIWVWFARWSLDYARRSRHRNLLGPMTESLAMFLLVAPIVALAMFSTNAVTDEDVWVAVAGILPSLLFGSAVANPFARFLQVLGRLDQESRGPLS